MAHLCSNCNCIAWPPRSEKPEFRSWQKGWSSSDRWQPGISRSGMVGRCVSFFPEKLLGWSVFFVLDCFSFNYHRIHQMIQMWVNIYHNYLDPSRLFLDCLVPFLMLHGCANPGQKEARLFKGGVNLRGRGMPEERGPFPENPWESRWWQLKNFLFSPRTLGKIFTHFDGCIFFKRGWWKTTN